MMETDVRIEWLVLADAAEVVGGKLYMLGGGWERINVRTGFPFDHKMAVAVSVLVPWNRTNEKHALRLELVDEDGKVLVPIDGQFEIGRPPGAIQGQMQRVLVAFGIGFKIERAGTYSINGFIDGQHRGVTPFHVVQAPGTPAKKAPPPQPPAPGP